MSTRGAAPDPRTIDRAILASCILVAVIRRASGWDPLSLWLDDEWMAMVVRHASLSQITQLNIPAPLGFTVLEKLVASSAADLEWPLQVVPFVAGLLSIVLFWMLATRVLESRLALGLSTLYVACHPVMELYSVRVKHYTLDSISSLTLLLIAFWNRELSTRRFALLVCTALALSLFSFASLLLAACLIHACVVSVLVRSRGAADRSNLKPFFAWAGLFDLSVALLYVSVFSAQSNAAMKAFWHKYFLLFDSARSVGLFLGRGFGGFFVQAAGPVFAGVLIFVVLGLRRSARDDRLRPLAITFALLVAGLVVAATVRVYPMGPDRTGCFAYPLFWVLAAVGVDGTLQRVREESITRRRWVVILAGAFVLLCLFRPRVSYSDVRDRQAVQLAIDRQSPGKALLTTSGGLVAFAYYCGSSLTFRRSFALTQQFESVPEWQDLYVLPPQLPGVSFQSDADASEAVLVDLAARGYEEIVFLTTHATEEVDAFVLTTLSRWGYGVLERSELSPRARVSVLRRMRANKGLR